MNTNAAVVCVIGIMGIAVIIVKAIDMFNQLKEAMKDTQKHALDSMAICVRANTAQEASQAMATLATTKATIEMAKETAHKMNTEHVEEKKKTLTIGNSEFEIVDNVSLMGLKNGTN